MKQIILLTSEKDKYEPIFKENGYYVTWCPMSIEELIKVRDHSDVIFVCATDENSEFLKDMGLYLRDLCIESEKILYIYGKREAIQILRSRIPTIYIQQAEFSDAKSLPVMLKSLSELNEASSSDKPGLLIIDNDNEYIGQLRTYLEPHYQVYVSHYDMREAVGLLRLSKVVLMGFREKHSLLDIMDFFRVAARRKISEGLRVYYLASDDEERNRVNAGSEKGNLAFSRVTDPARLAHFFINLKHTL